MPSINLKRAGTTIVPALFLFLKMRLPKKDIAYVVVQTVLFMAFVFDIQFLSINSYYFLILSGIILLFLGAGIAGVALLQLNTNLSPFPTPKTNSKLITHGIYKYIRHPIYTGILFLGIGGSLVTASVYRILITLLLFVLFYFKSNYEEKQLLKKFIDYSEYKKTSGRFLPKR